MIDINLPLPGFRHNIHRHPHMTGQHFLSQGGECESREFYSGSGNGDGGGDDVGRV